MIQLDSHSIEWMQQVASENNFKDITLIEKTIRAFSLLESLVLSGCPFVFKGGTSLMLHLKSAKRLSIDIDIICPPGTDIEQYLQKCAHTYGFKEVRLVKRQNANNIPKSHAKFFYQVTYATTTATECILLDVLFEDIHYCNVVQLPIVSHFLISKGEATLVNVPSSDDLLGDKLTAFAPNTTGIPYFKGDKSCTMEIIKQLFDVASLFDITKDMTVVSETFRKFATVELTYRNLNPDDIAQVLDDIYQTSLCICLQGAVNADNFKQLQEGIRRIQSYIHSEKYHIETAIVNASKAAYLSVLITNEIKEVKHFDPKDIEMLRNVNIESPLPSKLNKLKRTNIEAFYYWFEISKLANTFLPLSL